jgi:translation initiation factor 2B subunit (eIF-2B alpha/beta/delta family)
VYSEEFQEQISDLKADKTSGSEEIVRKAILLINNEIQKDPDRYGKIMDLSEMLREVISIKKEMSALRNVLIYFIDFFQHGVAVEDLADRVIQKMDDQREHLIEKLLPIISKCKNIATMSRSSTIFNALRKLSEIQNRENLPELTIFESRPALEGKKLALEVVNLGYRVNYLVDAAVGRAIHSLNPDLVLIGADTIFPNGNVVNKIGCHALAIFAVQHKVPLYVVSTTLKLLLKSIPFTIQSYPSTEVWAKDKPDEVKVYNPYFEIIPASLIAGFITEHGFSTNIPDVKLVLEKEYIREMYE